MRKYMTFVAGVACVALLAGCGGRRLGSGPDEFAVARQAPLVIPPDYALVPPQPGAARPQDNNPSQQALDALFGGSAPRSALETGVISSVGRDAAEPGIRSSVDARTVVVDKGSTTRDIVAAPEGDGQDARASATGAVATPVPATPQ
ncbi:MAG: hypothetical protein JWN21_645 [Sphingomonas bacterium]|uniref:DUF3035 domain-containing protein n=1 Tax=Sphingomonas bacterium TaxID=1895847 RepID=UPI00260640BF|nr:DUF3035 domain-containing protein [Sphingomonas bacterium]MDB5695102.1 hypothetical protein [Sphingomonas bacterium]